MAKNDICCFIGNGFVRCPIPPNRSIPIQPDSFQAKNYKGEFEGGSWRDAIDLKRKIYVTGKGDLYLLPTDPIPSDFVMPEETPLPSGGMQVVILERLPSENTRTN